MHTLKNTLNSTDVEISVVIPCFNSEKSILELSKRLTNTLSNLHISYEIIYINDCSSDKTLDVLKSIVDNDKNSKAVDLMFNAGQFLSIYCGLEISKGNFIVTIDDDLQHNPEEIKKLYNAILEDNNLDAVFGKYQIKKDSLFKKIGSLFIKAVNEKIFKKPKNLYMSSFRIMRRQLVDTILGYRSTSFVLGPIILKSTSNIINVDVNHNYRQYNSSGYSLTKIIKTTLDNIISFSSIPLQIISVVGIFASLISIIFAIFYFVQYFIADTIVPGWTTIIIFINFYGGLTLLSLGVVGEYLIRILKDASGFPRYSIRKTYY
jgi:glycosyltransferase involved in cell wall biosynthesis